MTEVSGLINLSMVAGSLTADLEAVSLGAGSAGVGVVAWGLRCASIERGVHKIHARSRNPMKVWA